MLLFYIKERDSLLIERGNISSQLQFMEREPPLQTNNDRVDIKEYLKFDHLEKIAYVDIETNGLLEKLGDNIVITSIALFDGIQLTTYTPTNMGLFANDILQFQAIVTFNGDKFDLAILKKKLNINWEELPILSIDLYKLGFSVRQKKSKKLSILKHNLWIQDKNLANVNGIIALILWNKFNLEGNNKAYQILRAYNAQDAIVLRYIAQYYFQDLRKRQKILLQRAQSNEDILKRFKLQMNQILDNYISHEIGLDVRTIKETLVQWKVINNHGNILLQQ